MKTISQLAKELNVTKTAVRKYLTDDIRNQFAETVSGVIYISEQGERLIISKLSKNKAQTEKASDSANDSENQSETVSGVSDTVSALVSTLQNQLNVKDTQINDLQTELNKEREHNRQQSERLAELSDKLAELTRNSQILLKQEQDKNTHLLSPGDTSDNIGNIASSVNSKTTLWSRLFKKK